MNRWCNTALVLIALAAPSAIRAADDVFESDGVKVRYVTEGKGEPVVLIYAWMADSGMWGKNRWGDTQIISTLAKEFRVIALDCRGHGKSNKPLPPEVLAAYDAPFPDVTYKAGVHQFPLLVPVGPDSPAVPTMHKTRDALRRWTKPALVLFSDKDPITSGGDRWFRALIPSASAEPEIVIEDAGHFLLEDKGEEIAGHIGEFLERRP